MKNKKKKIIESSTTNKIGRQKGGATTWLNDSWEKRVEYWRKILLKITGYEVLNNKK